MKPPHDYVRSGECLVGCGACCKSIDLPVKFLAVGNQIEVDRVYVENPSLRYWAELHSIRFRDSGHRVIARLPEGWSLRESSYGEVAHVPQRCSALTEDGRCSLYGRSDRPILCGLFPVHPLDLEGLEQVCAYKFKGV